MKQNKIILSPKQQEKFQTVIKRGILKELHQQNMLSNSQLSFLLSELSMAAAVGVEPTDDY